MSGTQKRILTVFGATGNQGGSVIKTILAHPELSAQFSIRGVTRDPSKPAAQALETRGVELVKADISDVPSINTAIEGSYAVFAVTNYWDHLSKETEILQGKNIVDACIATRVQHLIWSSLPDVSQMTSGLLRNVEHFDSKAEVSRYAEQQKKNNNMWVTHIMAGVFMDNIRINIHPDHDTGVPTLLIPWSEHETKVPLLDVRADIGKYVTGILLKAQESDGAFIQAVSEWLTPAEMLSTLNEYRAAVSGPDNTNNKKNFTLVAFKEIPRHIWQTFLPFPEHAQIDLGELMELTKDWKYYGKETDAVVSAENKKYIDAVGEKPSSWAEFVKANGPWDW